MIVFTLRCAHGHHFEEWFHSNADYDARKAAGEVPCPDCGDTHVGKALMAPRLNKGSSAPQPACAVPDCANGMCPMAARG
jgi:hypothetical protein